MNGGEMEHEMIVDGMDEVFTVCAYEFGEGDEAFVKLMRQFQDYDDSKHENWIVIP